MKEKKINEFFHLINMEKFNCNEAYCRLFAHFFSRKSNHKRYNVKYDHFSV